jgi:hypothetical protein
MNSDSDGAKSGEGAEKPLSLSDLLTCLFVVVAKREVRGGSLLRINLVIIHSHFAGLPLSPCIRVG